MAVHPSMKALADAEAAREIVSLGWAMDYRIIFENEQIVRYDIKVTATDSGNSATFKLTTNTRIHGDDLRAEFLYATRADAMAKRALRK